MNKQEHVKHPKRS